VSGDFISDNLAGLLVGSEVQLSSERDEFIKHPLTLVEQ